MSLAVILIQPLRAQEDREKAPDFEKFNAMRIAFITERVELTSAEAEKFWPVYNDYQKMKKEIRDKRQANHKYFMDNAAVISDKEAEDLLAQYMQLQKQENDLDIEYNEKFREVLSAKKVFRLYMAEMHFKSYLLHQIRGHERRGQQPLP